MGFKKYILKQFKKHPLRSGIATIVLLQSVPVVGLWEATFVPETGYWNPVKQVKYESLYHQFINFADRDNDGCIDFAEQVDAWKRMGQKGPFFRSKGPSQFSSPTIEGLEKAVNSYKQDEYFDCYKQDEYSDY